MQLCQDWPAGIARTDRFFVRLVGAALGKANPRSTGQPCGKWQTTWVQLQPGTLEAMRRIVSTILIASAVGVSAAAKPPAHYNGWRLAQSARFSMADAEQIALENRPGIIVSRELEKETGGSGLRYSFDIKSASQVFEVGVDARTGKVLENDLERTHPD
jgi:hypothetical protein